MLTTEQVERFDALKAKIKEVKYLKLTMDERREYQTLKALSVHQEEPGSAQAEEPAVPDRPNRDRLLDAFNEMKDADARSGIGQVLQVPGIDSMSVVEVLEQVFQKVHDGDARAIVHKYFNLQ